MVGIKILGRPLRLTAALLQSLQPQQTRAPNVPISSPHWPVVSGIRRFSTDTAATTTPRAGDSPLPTDQRFELTPAAAVVDGCDYEHWLVVVEPPGGYPGRSQIVQEYIKTLAMGLGSEEEAKRSIYSVSTKYYYAFGCKMPENFAHKIKSLPNVRWLLPDSYLCYGENGYGGEPFVEGEVVPYDEKVHADWLRDKTDGECQKKCRSRKSRRKERKK